MMAFLILENATGLTQDSQLWVRSLTSRRVADFPEKVTYQANGMVIVGRKQNNTGNATSKWEENFQTRSLSRINIIGQLSQLMEHKIMVGFDSVDILDLDFFSS